MTSEALASKPKQDVNSLARRMAIALIAGLGIGALLLFLRENLITNGHQETWNIINNLFFQDISTEEGKNAIGLFYIIGQLFINCLQLIIVQMIF